jgi:hypothetical protein
MGLEVLVESQLVVDDSIYTGLFRDFGFRDFGQNYSSINLLIDSTDPNPLFYSIAWSVVPVQGSVSRASELNNLVTLDSPVAGQLIAASPLSVNMNFNCSETFVLGLITTLTLQNSSTSTRYEFKWTKVCGNFSACDCIAGTCDEHTGDCVCPTNYGGLVPPSPQADNASTT